MQRKVGRECAGRCAEERSSQGSSGKIKDEGRKVKTGYAGRLAKRVASEGSKGKVEGVRRRR